ARKARTSATAGISFTGRRGDGGVLSPSGASCNGSAAAWGHGGRRPRLAGGRGLAERGGCPPHRHVSWDCFRPGESSSRGLERLMNSSQPDAERAFAFLRVNERQPKPRTRGMTEIRGPYYSPMGPRYLQDVLETMGRYVDALKFAGGS